MRKHRGAKTTYKLGRALLYLHQAKSEAVLLGNVELAREISLAIVRIAEKASRSENPEKT